MKKEEFKNIFKATVPVLAGYLVLGMGFGFMLKSCGYGIGWALAMSALIYAGSMQYLAVGLLSGGASLLTFALTTLTVNARHLFYGISMLDAYKDSGKKKPYLYFALTDETYSLVCAPPPGLTDAERQHFYFWTTLLDHIYWVVGSAIGSLLGSALQFNTEGVDFALTALFLTVFTDQWLHAENHRPALIGVAASVLCLLLLGSDRFLIPAMLLITLILILTRKTNKEGHNG